MSENSSSKKSSHYVNNAEMLAKIIEYKKKYEIAENQGDPLPQIPEYLAKCIMLICENLASKHNFNAYTFKDEMILDGVENCIRYFNNFDPDKSSNPFAYFTQIVYYAFLRRIEREKKQLYAKYKYTEKVGLLDEFEQLEDENGYSKQFEMHDNISEFIENYEIAKQKKRDAKTKKNLELFLDDLEEENIDIILEDEDEQ